MLNGGLSSEGLHLPLLEALPGASSQGSNSSIRQACSVDALQEFGMAEVGEHQDPRRMARRGSNKRGNPGSLLWLLHRKECHLCIHSLLESYTDKMHCTITKKQMQ
mmetsp:Transcript_21150/g.33159  ORF Transcript_21150/g.33159 Transcript_21150/m.33159 type:complete len:106 (+) Transcript_21150:766-1083(+)